MESSKLAELHPCQRKFIFRPTIDRYLALMLMKLFQFQHGPGYWPNECRNQKVGSSGKPSPQPAIFSVYFFLPFLYEPQEPPLYLHLACIGQVVTP